MRRRSATGTCLVLTPVLGGLAACSGSDGTPATDAPSTTSVAKRAGAATTTAEGLGPGKLATFVLEGVLQEVGIQGYSFLGDLLFGSGDVTAEATTEKLDAIQSQLDQINTRLDTTDTDLISIRGQMSGDVLSGKLDAMNQWNNKMTSLYQEYLTPIASAAKNVSVAKKNVADAQQASCAAGATCPAPPAVPSNLTDALATSTTRLQDAKQRFDSAFMLADPYTVLADQHDELYPWDPNVDSVLKLAGRSMESKGFATRTDSQRLQAMYLTLSGQEALTSMLVFEHDRMFSVDAATQKRHRDDYVASHAVEEANLAPEIPWGQVKVGQQMFLVPGSGYQIYYPARPWLPINPEGTQLGQALTTCESGNPGWGLPTDAQITALYDGTKNVPVVAGSTHLGSVWRNSGRTSNEESPAMAGWGMSTYWTKSTSASNPMTCTVGQYREVDRVYTLHHMAVMSGATAMAIQGQPGRIPDRQQGSPNSDVECDSTLVNLDDNDTYAARVMLTRGVDANTQDDMAQRSTALPAAPSTSTTSN